MAGKYEAFVYDSLVVICWERADLLALRLCYFTLYFTLCRLDFFVFLSRMVFWEGSGWNSIVSVPDYCLFLYFSHIFPSIYVPSSIYQFTGRLFDDDWGSESWSMCFSCICLFVLNV